MNFLRLAACTVVVFTFANPVFAQEAAPVETARVEASAPDGGQAAGDQFGGQLPRPGQPMPTDIVGPRRSDAESGGFFKLVASDFKHFFSADTGRVMAYTSVSAIAAAPWDREGINNGFGIPTTVFQSGNVIGSFAFQISAGAATYGVGLALGNGKAAMVGRDIVRAQIVSQVIAQGVKFTVRRERPDHSNRQSFPSGHSASAFATATVLQRHYGWKAGIPAYGLGSYVALARMSWNKHHATDVVMGAGLGIAAGRTVTMKVGGSKFNLGVQPQVGGASINFTKVYK